MTLLKYKKPKCLTLLSPFFTESLRMKCGVLVVLVVSLLLCFAGQDGNMSKIFQDDQIVGDILDLPPESCLVVKGCKGELKPGQEVTPDHAKIEPKQIMWDRKPDKLYTLLCLDPDALSRTNPEYRSVVHWMVTNIGSDDLKQADINIPYFGPSPPKNSGLHRYVFLVHEQLAGKINVTDLQYTEYLGNQYAFKFSLRDFIEKYQLSKAPVAGNYFQAQNMEK